MLEVLDIGASGLVAQRVRMDTIADNVLHINTTRNARGEKVPYQRRFVVFSEGQESDASKPGVHAEVKLDDEIAEALNTEGLQTSKKRPFNHNAIWFLRRRLGLPAVKPNGPLPARWEDGAYSVRGAAEAIGVCTGTIHKWLSTGRIRGEQPRKDTPWRVFLTQKDIEELRDYVERVKPSHREVP